MSGIPNGLPRLYTAAEVAEAMQCSVWWVQEQVRRRRFPHEEVAGGCRFTAEQYAAIVSLLAVLPSEDSPAVRAARPTLPTDTAEGVLKARVPPRLRKVPPIDNAA